MIRTTIAVAVLGLFSAASAQAGVVYNWQPLSEGEFSTAVSGELVVAESAYRRGSVTFDYDNYKAGEFNPIQSVGLWFTGHGNIISTNEDNLLPLGTTVNTSLRFEPNGLLSGFLDVFAESTNFDSSGQGALWEVNDVNSDYFSLSGHCTSSYDEPCFGGTGFWLLDESTVRVPEPGSLAVMGLSLGLIGCRVASRRRNARSRDSAMM